MRCLGGNPPQHFSIRSQLRPARTPICIDQDNFHGPHPSRMNLNRQMQKSQQHF